MTRIGPAWDDDQRDLAAMLDALAADRGTALEDDPRTAGALIAELAELGVWTLGADEQAGGGGADRTTAVVAWERLGRAWPALAWASVQAHAAVDVLAADDRSTGLVARVHTGEAAVAVVDARSAHVHLVRTEQGVSGRVDRVDAAAPAPHLLLLTAPDQAVLIPPEATTATPLRRTGLGGAHTRALAVDAPADTARVLDGVPADRARTRLFTGAAAIAAGIAGAAAQEAAAYAADRRQFGGPLTEIPTVRQALLDQAARTEVVLDALWSAGDDPAAAFSVARHACDTAIDVAASAVQVHGGYGYLAEYPVERRLRDAVSLRAAADTRTAALTAARALVGLAPAPVLEDRS